MAKDILDPGNILKSPYDTDRIPPPTIEELAQMGLKAKSDEKAVQISTKIRPEILYAIDRIVERRLYKLKSRHDVFRLALMNLVVQLEEEIQSEHVQSLVRRADLMRQTVAELHLMKDVITMITSVQKAVEAFLNYDNVFDAIKVLRNAKRFSEEIPYEGLRKRFVNHLYGSVDGKELPEGWEQVPSAKLWNRVLEGELDRDDAEEMARKTKVF